MICYNCGNEVNTEGTNCPFCGAPLNIAAPNQPNPGFEQQAQNFQQGNERQAFDQQGYQQQGEFSMDPKTAAIVCYITWIGLVLAVVMADRNDPFFKFHLNNSLILVICGFATGIVGAVLCLIPIIGWLIFLAAEVFLLVCLIMGLVSAVNGECKPLPLIGEFQILK